ncbi:fibronectin type III domain-containing protein 3B-like [Styela clava]
MENEAPGRVVETTWDQKYIKFQWRRTEGIKHYTLVVRNVLDKTKEIIHKDFPENKCQHRRELKKELRIGQTCEIRLKIFCPNDVVKDSQWETCIIGGPKVTRNPTAMVNLEKPTRSLHAQWMEPEIKPDSYEVVCIPTTGKRKTQKCFKTNTTFNRLKTNTNYRILVRAVYADDRGHDSETNIVSTHAKPSATLTTQYSHIHSSSIRIEKPTTVNHSQVTNVRKDDFDKPRNVETKMSTNDGGIEMATVSWEPPGFSGESDDYEILQYDVKVLQDGHTMFTKHLTDQSCTEKFLINLGKCYTVHIKTKYEEIDTEKIIEADLKTVFHSRPTEPNVRVGVDKQKVLVRWDSSRGAERYELKIFESESKRQIEYQEISKSLTKHTKPIGDFNLGTYYTFQVTAHGKDNRYTTKTINYLIGGGSIPRMAKAFLNKEKPTECVDLRWEAPEESIPSHYLVKEANRSDMTIKVNATSCSLDGLKSGLPHQFSIIAVYNSSKSDGCLTNEVTTDPRPSYAQNLQIKLDDQHPDKMIICKWDETPNATMYKIQAMSDDFLQEHVIKNLQFKFENLPPDTEYRISVKAGNKSGYGKDSQDKIKTEIWVPADISLHADGDNSLTVQLNQARHGLQNIVSLFEARNDVYVEEKSTHESVCRFDKVRNNTTYFVKVQTVNGVRKSRITRSKNILTRPKASVIKSLDLCSGNQSTDINIEWELQNGILYYEIEIQTNQEIENVLKVTNTNRCKYRCLQEGNEYTVRVRAANTFEFGEWCESSSILLAPPKISGLTAEVIGNKIVVEWKELPCNIPFYLIQVFVGERLDEKVYEKNIDIRKFELIEPLPCTKHKFVVSAYNINDILGKSASIEILTGLLHPPKWVKASLDELRPCAIFHFEWDWPKSAKSFLIYGNDECIGNNIEENKFTFCDAKPTETYRIKLYSMCGSIRSEYPVTTSITADDVPGIDSDSIKVILDDTKPWEKATISWKMPPGVEHVSVAIKSHHLQVARNRLHSVYQSKASPYVEIRQEIHKKTLLNLSS